MELNWNRLNVYYHPVFLEHLAEINHPECPDRLQTIIDHLEQQQVWARLNVVSPEPAKHRWIETNHDKIYAHNVKRLCERAPAVLDGGDTIVTRSSYRAALHAAGACIAGIDDLTNERAEAVFCMVRPPGHHAEYDEAMGFCLFNNIAIAARYAIEKHALQRIFILDWDVHHGNGTQHSFEDVAEVFVCNIHQWPLYPGTGAATETGRGIGHGYTLNLPLAAGHGDETYLQLIEEKVLPAIEHYNPDLLLISAGFDAHSDDPLAGMDLSTDGYLEMTRMLRRAMRKVGRDKILSVLEGGYNQVNLAESVLAHLKGLAEQH